MKNLVLTLLLFCFASTVIYAKNPKDNFLKKLSKLSDIQDNSQTECDLCGCYMGLDPYFSKNQIGLRYHVVKFYAAPSAPATIAQTDNTGLPNQVMHETAGQESTEYYTGLELYARFYINPKLRLLFSIPFSFNEIDSKKLNGVGDMRALVQYQIYNTNMTGETNFWQRIFLGGGLKLPTGVYNKSLVYYGLVEPHFQPGTGSFDLILTGLYMAKLEMVGLGWRNDIVYTINSENKNNYRFSNRFNLASTFTYDYNTSSVDFVPHAGVYFETANADKENGVTAEGTGGSVLFGTAGIDSYYNDFSLDFNYQFPITQNLFGSQPENEFRIYLSLGYSF